MPNYSSLPALPTNVEAGSSTMNQYRDEPVGGYRDDDVPGSHELDDFYAPNAIPAPYRLSTISNNSLPRNSSSAADLTSIHQSRSTASMTGLAGDSGGYEPVDSPGLYKEAYGTPPAYYDPQGRSGARYQASRQQVLSESPAAAAAKGSKKKWLIWVAAAIVAIAVVVGVAVGVTMAKKNKSTSSSNLASGTTASDGSNGTTSTNSSSYANDSRLHNSFYGIAYTPQSALPPWCGATQANVTRDIIILSQLTTRLRLYGALCNQTALVLQAIQDTGVDMSIYVAIYVDSNSTAFDLQLSAVEDALKTYGTKNVLGVSTGNEYILDAITPSSDLTTAAAQTAIKTLLGDVQTVNTTIKGLDLTKQLPMGTSDAGSAFNVQIAEGIDYFMANVHPYFGSVSINDAAGWTWQFFQTFDVDVAAQATNKPNTMIAETGWPTASMDAASGNDGAPSPGGDASVANLQTFLDTFVCAANTNGTEYFYFEAFDEPWKEEYGGVEPYWGLFNSDRVLKNVTIPSCSHN